LFIGSRVAKIAAHLLTTAERVFVRSFVCLHVAGDSSPAAKRQKHKDTQIKISFSAADHNLTEQSFAKYLVASSTDSKRYLTNINISN